MTLPHSEIDDSFGDICIKNLLESREIKVYCRCAKCTGRPKRGRPKNILADDLIFAGLNTWVADQRHK